MKRLQKKHPRAIRWMHWVNFPVLLVMIWSGLLIYWANSVYRIGFGKFTLFEFFPDRFFNFLGVGHRLAEGMALHFFFMLRKISRRLQRILAGEPRSGNEAPEMSRMLIVDEGAICFSMREYFGPYGYKGCLQRTSHASLSGRAHRDACSYQPLSSSVGRGRSSDRLALGACGSRVIGRRIGA